MNAELPIHPLLVHLPLALAVLMPLLGAGALLAGWRGWLPERRLWIAVVLLQGVLVVGAVAALLTGEREEERVEAVVAERILEAHEEAGRTFLTAAGGTLALGLLGSLLPGARWRRAFATLGVVGMLGVAYLGVRVGEAGGELVYRHGAASVYAPGLAGGVPTAVGERDDD